MADENRDRPKKADRDKAQSASGGQRRDTPSGDEREKSDQFEADDVAEDRNLSGASTWLNLPEQPEGKPDEDEDEDPGLGTQ